MLFHYEYFNHPTEKFEKYICHFIRAVRHEAPTRSRFSVYLCHPDFQIYVKRAPTLKKHLSSFFRAFRNLPAGEQTLVYKAFISTKSVKMLLNNQNDCYRIEQLPMSIRKPTKTLFKYLYKTTLDSVGNVKDHYKQFYDKLSLKLCPFCGIENLLHYEHYKQDYDHLLYKDKYPFAAVNMKNLVPMGRNCNTIFKKQKDILHDNAETDALLFTPLKAMYKFLFHSIKVPFHLQNIEKETGLLNSPQTRKKCKLGTLYFA